MPSVLITGASRGIGRAAAEHMAAKGWDVIAGVRSERDAETVSALPRVSPVLLDVTDDDQIAALPAALPDRLDAVVNNAGVVVAGPMETVSSADWRRLLDVNVVGQLAVTRAVLPRLRASRGRIVFVSSVNGRVSMPIIGAYSASKFALEAAADALRMELRPWRIPVSLIEPAQTDTDMWRTADTMVEDLEAGLSAEHRALYAKHITGMKKMVPVSQRMAVPTDTVTAVIERALTARWPRARYPVGAGPRLQTAVMTTLPTTVRDLLLRKVFGQP
ncbi:SDR family NAD(P)-dependent oxidoreductase [Mycolicibacterium phlei]